MYCDTPITTANRLSPGRAGRAGPASEREGAPATGQRGERPVPVRMAAWGRLGRGGRSGVGAGSAGAAESPGPGGGGATGTNSGAGSPTASLSGVSDVGGVGVPVDVATEKRLAAWTAGVPSKGGTSEATATAARAATAAADRNLREGIVEYFRYPPRRGPHQTCRRGTNGQLLLLIAILYATLRTRSDIELTARGHRC